MFVGATMMGNIDAAALEAATNSINAKYDELGGASGILGGPATEVTVCPDGRGYYRHFLQNASIYWSPETGAHSIHGPIRGKWSAMGWERSFLGYPTGDESLGRNPQTAGSCQVFQGGYLFSQVQVQIAPSPALGPTQPGGAGQTTPIPVPAPLVTVQEVHGLILAKYLELGGELSFLGYPTTDESGCPDNIGRFNHFQGGSIYWTPSTGAHEVHGLIRDFWATHGWERNPALGYPLSDESTPTPAVVPSTNRFSDFENGVLFWRWGSGAAEALAAWPKAADGTILQKSAADILAAITGPVAAALQAPATTVVPSFAGTTPYLWDGAGWQNRRHQIQVYVTTQEGSTIPISRNHSVTLSVLVTLDAQRRKIRGYLADYSTSDPMFAPKLDPMLWSAFDIATFPDTNGGKRYSILSVKTAPNGDVNTYIEP